MATFPERLTELMAEKEIKSRDLAANIGVSNSTVADWKRGKFHLFLSNAIKLADFFECSIDYLVGRSNDYSNFSSKPCPSFYPQFIAVMKECGVSTYRLRLDSAISGRHLTKWKQGADPLIVTLITAADFLKVTLDHLVGRED